MKNRFFQILIAAVMMGTVVSPVHSYAQEAVKVSLDGQTISFDVAPVVEHGTILVPFRTIFEQLGMAVSWNEQDKSIRGEKTGRTIQMTIGVKTASVNGKTVQLSAAPKIIHGSTMIPLRFVSEATGNKVDWNADTRTVSIQTLGTGSTGNIGEMQLSGLIYKGELKDGKPNGQGKLYDNAQTYVYEGGFKDGLFEGQGKIYNNNILIVDGTYSNNKLNGMGKVYDHKGNLQYEGQFVDDLKSGNGTLYAKDSTYTGQFSNDLPNGKGTYKYNDGSSYTGGVKDGLYEGSGTLIYTDGSKYEGQFHNGKFEGEGKRYSASGEVVEQGVYSNGKLKPAEVKKIEPTVSLEEFFTQFKAKFQSVQVGSATLYFDYNINPKTVEFRTTIIAFFSQNDSTTFMNLYNNNKEELKRSLQNLANEIESFSTSKGYYRILLFVMGDANILPKSIIDPSDATAAMRTAITIFEGSIKLVDN